MRKQTYQPTNAKLNEDIHYDDLLNEPSNGILPFNSFFFFGFVFFKH